MLRDPRGWPGYRTKGGPMPRPMKAAGRSARPSRLRAIWPKVPRSAMSRGSAILSVTIVAMVLASTPLMANDASAAVSSKQSPTNALAHAASATTLANAPASLRSAVEKGLGSGQAGTGAAGLDGRALQLGATYGVGGAQFAGAGFDLTVGRGSVGREDSVQAVAATIEHRTHGAVYGQDGIIESFHPTEAGIEQTFTITRRPSGPGPLSIDVPVSGLQAVSGHAVCPPDPKPLLPPQFTLPGQLGSAAAIAAIRNKKCAPNGPSVDLVDAHGGVRAIYSGLRVTDVAGKVVPATMQAAAGGAAIVIDIHDANARYPLRVDPTWFQVQELTASDPANSGAVGYSVAISGTTAIVGDELFNDGQGAALVFTLENSAWTQTAMLSVSGTQFFGQTVAISGTTAARPSTR